MLKNGRKDVFIGGGTDAHGAFSHTFECTVPPCTSGLTQETDNAFGKVRTFIYTETFTNSNILDALKKGHSIMTDGPIVVFDITNEKSEKAIIGDEITGNQLTLNVEWKSTSNFGNVNGVYFFRGVVGEDEEELTDLNFAPNNKFGKKSININSHLPLGKDSYIRVVATTMRINEEGLVENNRAYTNPIFINKINTGPLDLIFVIDTTGSMGDDIAAVKSSANEIVNTLDSKTNDYRISVVDYRDYPQAPYGQPGLDYVYKLDLPFSNDKNTIINSINSLSLGNGADWQESVYSALVKTMTDTNKDLSKADNYGWRKGATKAIILMCDAPPHDPEPWSGSYSLADVTYWSQNIDPVIVYSVAIGYDSITFDALSEISEKTGGKVYTSPTASDIVDTIIEVIGDIGEPTANRGVSVNITPALNETNPGSSAIYSANITNQGTIVDTYNISVDLNNIAGSYRGYPLVIQSSWITLNSASAGLGSGVSEIRPLTINVPYNWAGMENVIYSFSITAKSETDGTISNTSSAELKVIADKRSMAEYSKLEIQWLSELIKGSSIDEGIKNALLAKLSNSGKKVDTALASSNDYQFDINLQTAQNVINAFINQVEAQYDKKIMQPDANMLIEKANQILEDIEKAKNT